MMKACGLGSIPSGRIESFFNYGTFLHRRTSFLHFILISSLFAQVLNELARKRATQNTTAHLFHWFLSEFEIFSQNGLPCKWMLFMTNIPTCRYLRYHISRSLAVRDSPNLQISLPKCPFTITNQLTNRHFRPSTTHIGDLDMQIWDPS